MMSRVLNSKIPILPALQEPKDVDPRPQLEQRQRRHKGVFDRGARELPKLEVGERVRMRHNHVWTPAILVREDGHLRPYIVKRSGTEYRRNRRDLLQTAKVLSRDDPIDDPIVDAPPAPHVGVVPVAPQDVPFRQVISDKDTAFTVRVGEFRRRQSFWGSARNADEVPKGYAVNTVEGGFKVYECDVQCPVMFIAFLDNLSVSKDMFNG